MDESLLVHFSKSDKNLSQIHEALNNTIGVKLILKSYQDKSVLFQFLESNPNRINVHIIVLDIDDSDSETIRFINVINQFSPNSLKLLVSESDTLLKIQQEFYNWDSIHYINRLWDKNDYVIALNSAKSFYFNLQILLKYKSDLAEYSKNLEERVSLKLEELSKSNMAKDKFFSIIAHDLKSPFAALLGLSDILIKDWADLPEEDKLDLVKGLKTSSENTYRLVENLLIWSKSQMDKLEVVKEIIIINKIIDSAIEINRSFANQKQISIKNHIVEELQVIGDKDMISTVCRNLISNAVNHIQVGGKVEITATEEQDYFTFCIEDNGSGIQKANIVNYFKPNNIGATPDASKIKTLGLVLCKEFVERNGGQIWLETEKDKGSKFFFSIPAYK